MHGKGSHRYTPSPPPVCPSLSKINIIHRDRGLCLNMACECMVRDIAGYLLHVYIIYAGTLLRGQLLVRSVCMVQYKHTGYTCVYRRNTGVAGPWEWIVFTFCLRVLLGAVPYFRSAYFSMRIRILQFSAKRLRNWLFFLLFSHNNL